MIFVCGGVLARWRVDSVPLGERCDCGAVIATFRQRRRQFSLIALPPQVASSPGRAEVFLFWPQRVVEGFRAVMLCCKRAKDFYAALGRTRLES